MSDRTSSAAWLRGVVEALGSAGLDVAALCAEAGIALAPAAAAGTACPTEKLSLLWQLAAARSGNPAIALVAPRVIRPANFEVVGYAMMSSPTLRAALERLVRYLRILSDAATVVLTEGTDTCRLTLDLYGGARPVPRQRYEFDLLTFLSFCSWIIGREWRPLVVELTHAAPADGRAHALAFQCGLRFDAPSNGFVLARSDLDLPLPAANPQMADLHDQFAGARIEQLDKARTRHKVRDLIIRRLPDGEPRREAIAQALHMTERTLQRRCQEEGTSFQQVMDDTRRELAERYLAQHHLSLAEASYLLGFAGQGNFTRACRRWFGLTPGQYRARAAMQPAMQPAAQPAGVNPGPAPPAESRRETAAPR